jgi:hypothetical protein
VVDPGLVFWLDRFHQQMIGEMLRARKRAKQKKSAVPNMSPLVRWGLSLLKSSQWKACWTDKTASYALVERKHIAALHHGVFDRRMYIPATDDKQQLSKYYAKYFNLVKKIQDFEDSPELGAQLAKSPKLHGASLISQLNFTVKSHKPQVSVRNLHCSGRYSFKGLGLWLQKQLAGKLACIPYLITNPNQVGQFLGEISLNEDITVYKIDIKEFFISGELESLKHDTMAVFENDSVAKCKFIADTMDLLLTSQFVRSSVTGRCVQVCEGSGMGLPQSGGIADAAFFIKAEQDLLRQDARRQAGIVAYLRFKDDRLIFSNNSGWIRRKSSRCSRQKPDIFRSPVSKSYVSTPRKLKNCNFCSSESSCAPRPEESESYHIQNQ